MRHITRLKHVLAVGLFASIVTCAAEAPEIDYAAEVRQADIDFSEQTAATGADGWSEYFLEDGIMFPRSGKVQGREAIRATMSGAFEPGTRLDWEPVTAVAAESGDLGYTIGRWASVVILPDGRDSIADQGNYVTIWQRDEAGQWKVAVDIGNPDQPPTP